MPGLFDALQNAKSGILAHQLLQEVVGQNIANASNENYTRQRATVQSRGSTFNGQHFYGQGVEVAEATRVRDVLLDHQIRDSTSRLGAHEVTSNWLQKIESVFNEPSDQGISAALTSFWEAWSDLGTDPESFAARSNVLTTTNAFTSLIKDVDARLERYENEVDQELSQSLDTINSDIISLCRIQYI